MAGESEQRPPAPSGKTPTARAHGVIASAAGDPRHGGYARSDPFIEAYTKRLRRYAAYDGLPPTTTSTSSRMR